MSVRLLNLSTNQTFKLNIYYICMKVYFSMQANVTENILMSTNLENCKCLKFLSLKFSQIFLGPIGARQK